MNFSRISGHFIAAIGCTCAAAVVALPISYLYSGQSAACDLIGAYCKAIDTVHQGCEKTAAIVSDHMK